MTITADHERPRADLPAGAADVVTFAFADPDRELYGLARVGLSTGPDGARVASGTGLLLSGVEAVAVRTAGGMALAEGEGFAAARAAGVRTDVRAPLEAWDVAFTSEDGASGFALRFEASAAPIEVDPLQPVAVAGGMSGYEQLCVVRGLATVRGEQAVVSGLGSRGHAWGATDWSRVAATRTVQAWLAPDLALSASAVRPVDARSHADEAVATGVVLPGPEGEPPLALLAEESTISTTYDEGGRQRMASLEAYLDVEGMPERAAGAVLCGTTLELGELRLECAFFAWAMEGRRGVGRYDVLRRAS